MSQPVKLSDALVLDARMAGAAQQRSIAGQVEFWARLGRSMELLLEGKTVLQLSRASASTSLSELLDVVDTIKGREIFKDYLQSEPFPHYEEHPTNPDLLIRIEEDGTRTVGRFEGRAFVQEVASDPANAHSRKVGRPMSKKAASSANAQTVGISRDAATGVFRTASAHRESKLRTV